MVVSCPCFSYDRLHMKGRLLLLRKPKSGTVKNNVEIKLSTGGGGLNLMPSFVTDGTIC